MGQKILLADDSITIQKVIELTFTDEDFELHTVGNGQKAIEQIRTVKPDIVLCDIIMPEKSGYEVCEHIKTSEDLKHIPVLLLTGAFEPFDQERAKKAGCDGFLAKPFEPQTLISKVKELLKSPARAGGTVQPSAPHAAAASAPNQANNVGTDASAAMPTPQAPPAAPVEDAGEATVMMSSGMTPPKPPVQPPAQAPPNAPAARPAEPPAASEGAGFEDLAVEAGERELSVDADDRTMFLGEPDESSDGTSEDIWGEVHGGSTTPTPPVPPSPPAPPESNGDEGKTVMMSSPIVPEPSEPAKPAKEDRAEIVRPEEVPGGFTELPSAPADSPEIVSGESTDDAWVIPGPDPTTESAEPELTPLGDFSGFDDFSADPAKPANVSEPAQSAQPSEPLSSVQGPAKDAGTEAEPWGEPVAPPPAPPAAKPVSPAPKPSEESFAEPGSSGSPVGFGGASAEPVSPATGSTAQAGTAALPDSDMDALADRVAKKVLSQLSEKVIQEIAWEVVPDLAETLIQKEIRKEIEELKAKIPR